MRNVPVFVPLTSEPWVAVKAADNGTVYPILECSSRSPDPVGKTLSAFVLTFDTPSGRTISVESAYQGSKVFGDDGPFQDLYNVSSRDAKTDRRLREFKRLKRQITGFDFFGRKFDFEPRNSFFNWLYLSSLVRRYPSILDHIGQDYNGFTDVFYGGLACQAESVAIAVALERQGCFNETFIKGLMPTEVS